MRWKREHPFDHGRTLFGITNVGYERISFTARIPDLLRHAVRIGLIQIRDHHRCPLACVTQSDGGSNATAAAGHQCNTSIESIHRRGLPGVPIAATIHRRDSS